MLSIRRRHRRRQAREFVKRFFANVPVLDGGGRGATTTFTQRGIGDALVTFENEAILIGQELGGDTVRDRLPLAHHRGSRPVAVVEQGGRQARHPQGG